MKNLIVKEKSFDFAVRIVKLYSYLKSNYQEYTISKQILKSGTSIGANIEEAIGGISKADFRSKMSIAYKEARETHYWLRLLNKVEFLNDKMYQSMSDDCEELKKILYTILKNSK